MGIGVIKFLLIPNSQFPIPKSTRELSLQSKFYLSCPGAYRAEETPGPISNPEAKLRIADDTAPSGSGKVGRRQAKVFFVSLENPHLLCYKNNRFHRTALFSYTFSDTSMHMYPLLYLFFHITCSSYM